MDQSRRDEEFWESDEDGQLVDLANNQEEDLLDESRKCCGCCYCYCPSYCSTLCQGLKSYTQTLWGALWSSGMGCMAFASAIQAVSALFVKLTAGRVPVFELVTLRSGICMVVTIAMIRYKGIKTIFGQRNNLPALFIRGLAGAVSMSIYYYAIFKLSLADVITVFFTHPAMVIVLAWLVRGEAVGIAGVLGVVCSMLGVLVIARPPFLTGSHEHWSMDHIYGVIASVIAALLAAVAFVAIRFIPKSEAPQSIALWFHTMGVVTAGLPLCVGIPSWPILPTLHDTSCIMGVALCSFSSHVFIARAFQVENAGKASAAGYLQVVFAYIFGVSFLDESVALFGVLGSFIVCLGVVATSWPAKKEGGKDQLGLPETNLESVREVEPLVETSPKEFEENRKLVPNLKDGLETNGKDVELGNIPSLNSTKSDKSTVL